MEAVDVGAPSDRVLKDLLASAEAEVRALPVQTDLLFY